MWLAEGNPSAALSLLGPLRHQTKEKGPLAEHLRVTILQAVALQMSGDTDGALQALEGALVSAEPGNLIRSFIDEGPPMTQLLTAARARGIMPATTSKLLAAAEATTPRDAGDSGLPGPADQQPLIEPLSERELEILHLVALGLTNRQISERLFITVSTVKGHNQRIYGKLQVQRRTEAVARARDLGLI